MEPSNLWFDTPNENYLSNSTNFEFEPARGFCNRYESDPPLSSRNLAGLTGPVRPRSGRVRVRRKPAQLSVESQIRLS